MKIREIFEEFPFQERHLKKAPHTSRELVKRTGEERTAPDAVRLGRGLYSGVYARASKPHDVRKVSEEWGIDGTYWYLQAIRRSKDSANPFFPRVRSLRVYKNEDGEAVAYTVEMERLRPMHELTQEEAAAMAERLFQGGWRTVVGLKDDHFVDIEHITSLINVAIDTSSDVDRFDLKLIRDPYLRRAIVLIRRLTKQFAPDIGIGNVMIRRTPYGPQLVITDPLA